MNKSKRREFKPGDKVYCIDSTPESEHQLESDVVYTIMDRNPVKGNAWLVYLVERGTNRTYRADRFELANERFNRKLLKVIDEE